MSGSSTTKDLALNASECRGKKLTTSVSGQLYFCSFLDIQDACKHLTLVKRSQIEDLWVYLQTLYTLGKDLRCARFQFTRPIPLRCSREGCNLAPNTLWVCLECPHAGCGRRYNQHALKHYEETGHMLSVKLLTLEFSCYICEQWLGEEGRPEVQMKGI